MSITLFSIINEQWENQPIDTEIQKSLITHKVLSYYSQNLLISPYSTALDTLIQDYEVYLQSRKNTLDNNDINEMYKQVYYFTQIQSNLTVYLNHFRSKVDQFKFVFEIYTELIKQQLEAEYAKKVTILYAQKEKEMQEIERTYNNKQISVNESKFITMKINNISEKYEILIGQYTWTRLNNLILSQLKTNLLLNEIKRKTQILESIVGYFELRFKNFQEEIMSGKKVIDNLSFLYKHAS